MTDIYKAVIALGALSKYQDQKRANQEQSEVISSQGGKIDGLEKEVGGLKRKLGSQEALFNHKLGLEESRSKKLENEKANLNSLVDFYKRIINLPLRELVELGYSDHKLEYAKQQYLISQYILNNKVIKELCEDYGVMLNKTSEDIANDLIETKDRLVNQESKYGNNISEEEMSLLFEFANVIDVEDKKKTNSFKINAPL